MARFEICTTDGKAVTVEHREATPMGVLNAARKEKAIEGHEVWQEIGRDEHRNPVAIPFEAIVLIRPKG